MIPAHALSHDRNMPVIFSFQFCPFLMSVVVSESPIHAFYQFLGRRLDGGDTDLTPEQSVHEFRLYQEEVARFLRETEPAAAQSRRGDTRPLDVDAVMLRVQQRLQQQAGDR